MSIASRLRRERLLAIVRGDDARGMVRAVGVLAAAGVGLIEVSLTSTDAVSVIRSAVDSVGDTALIGAGTVRTSADAKAAADAGAAFLVTPGGPWDGDASELPVVMGAFTPTEIARVAELDPVAVKLFPASLGGPGYLTAVRQPFPHLPFVPVGGIDAAAARAYLAAGAVAVGVGAPLLGDAACGGDLDALARRAETFMSAVAL